jgi:hypothetical protein
MIYSSHSILKLLSNKNGLLLNKTFYRCIAICVHISSFEQLAEPNGTSVTASSKLNRLF